eukprot:1884858-Ditylum_brightwellii.AAC.1
MQCLQHLKDAKVIGKYNWKWVSPSKSKYAALSPDLHETVILSKEGKGEQLSTWSYEQEHNVNHTPRKQLQQHLASKALQDLFNMVGDGEWSKMTMKEMSQQLQLQHNQKSSQ